MLITGRTEFFASGIVDTPPQLPHLSLGKAKLNVVDGFEENPSASLTFDAVAEADIDAIRSAYAVETEFSILGMPFIVSAYGDIAVRIAEAVTVMYGISSRYNVQINLEGKWGRLMRRSAFLRPLVNSAGISSSAGRSLLGSYGTIGVYNIAAAIGVPMKGPNAAIVVESNPSQFATITLGSSAEEAARLYGCFVCYSDKDGLFLKSLGGGKNWDFPIEAVIEQGVFLAQALPAYNFLEISGYFSTANSQGTPQNSPVQMSGPVAVKNSFGDLNPEIPYKDSYVLRDLSSNHDMSGPTKRLTETTEINGAPISQHSYLYGYAYLGSDIYVRGTDGLMYAPSAGFWRLIEYTVTNYIYGTIGSVSLSLSVQDPATGESIPVYSDPASNQNSATVKVFGATASVMTNASFLVSEQTTGWSLVRYAKEALVDEIPATIDAILNPSILRDPVEADALTTYRFFKQPIYSITQYDLKGESNFYPDAGGNPVSISIALASTIDPIQAGNLGISRTSRDGFVAIATPSGGYSVNMLIMNEALDERGFSYRPDPRSTSQSPKPVLTVGKETMNRTNRKVLVPGSKEKLPASVPERYEEYTREFSASDSSFAASIEQLKFKSQTGRPPTAASKTLTFTPTIVPIPSEGSSYQYFASSDFISPTTELGGSKSYPSALTFGQAVNAVTTELNIATIKTITATKKLSWFYPQIRAGDFVTIDGERYFVVRVTHNLSFNGDRPNGMSQNVPFCISDGCEVELAYWKPRDVFIGSRPSSSSSAGFSPDVSITGGQSSLGGISNIPAGNSRRNF